MFKLLSFIASIVVSFATASKAAIVAGTVIATKTAITSSIVIFSAKAAVYVATLWVMLKVTTIVFGWVFSEELEASAATA